MSGRVKSQLRGKSRPKDIWLPPISEEPTTRKGDNLAWFRRQVTGSSVDDLNMATHGIKGRRIARVLDVFSLTLVYPSELEKAIEHSPLENPPTTEELAKKLGNLPLGSLYEPIEAAKVLDVRPHNSTVAIYVNYPPLHEERMAMTLAVWEHLGLPYPYDVTPDESYITIAEGDASAGQIALIEAAVPTYIGLSPLKPGPSQ